MRVALGVEYDGSAFHGWQAQRAGIRTVQEVVEQALQKVADHPLRVNCAGRTDTGVHSTGQVIHFDTPSVRSPRNWLLGCNVNMPMDVNIRWAQTVPDDFHARFSATARHYRYLILNRTSRSALMSKRATWIHKTLDAQRMQQAGLALIGRHDFSSYRALHCQANSPLRTLSDLQVIRHGEQIELMVTADAFLHHMVRNIAGVLIAIGTGDKSVSWAQEVLQLKDRTRGGMTALADGLYFSGVDYPAEFQIPSAENFSYQI